MSQIPSTPDTDSSRRPNGNLPMLPEERFWKRHSPHHEFPLSGAASVALHLLAVAALVVAGLYLIGRRDEGKPIPADVIDLDGAEGKLPGDGSDPTKPPGAVNKEAVGTDHPASPIHPADVPKVQLNEPVAPQLALPHDPDAIGQSLEQAEKLKQTLNQLRKGIGNGDYQGPRSSNNQPGGPLGKRASLNERTARMDRWIMVFDTLNGHDYLHQLSALGAFLGVPMPENQYQIFRDLKQRPAQGKIEDVGALNRIFWFDSKPASVRSLAEALQLEKVPSHFAAFFPQSLEAELLQKELDYRNRPESEIENTWFRVQRKGRSYEVVVERQTYKAPSRR